MLFWRLLRHPQQGTTPRFMTKSTFFDPSTPDGPRTGYPPLGPVGPHPSGTAQPAENPMRSSGRGDSLKALLVATQVMPACPMQS